MLLHLLPVERHPLSIIMVDYQEFHLHLQMFCGLTLSDNLQSKLNLNFTFQVELFTFS